MQFFIILVLIGIFSSLFCLYLLSRDDIVFLRKNVSLEHIFNLAFLTILVGMFFARIFFVVFHFKPFYLNPLVFIFIPYYPGLSLQGGLLGGLVFLLGFTRLKKIPNGRIYDFFSIAYLCGISASFLSSLIGNSIVTRKIQYLEYGFTFLYPVLFLFFVLFFLPRLRRTELKDTTITLLFLFSYSAVTFIAQVVEGKSMFPFLIPQENGILMLLFFTSLALLLFQDKLFQNRIRK